MKLSGRRVDLQALTEEDLSASVGNYTATALEQALGLKLAPSILDEEMIYALKVRYSKVLQNGEHYLWYTCWAVIHREERQVIGFLILKGQPNAQGEVTIGYVIDEVHWGQGYATEAVECINEWIFSHAEACWVVADTEPDNIASHKVLQHLGAEQFRETEELLWWRIARPEAQS